MSQAPMMPVYPDALLGDTLDLTGEQFGCYLLLLFATWRNNGKPLSDDDAKLARICRCSLAHWRRVVRPAIIGFFDCGDGTLHQKRLEKEWAFVAKKREQNQNLGSLGGKATALKKRKSTISERSSERCSEPIPLPFIRDKSLIAREAAPPPLPSRGDGDSAATRAPNPKAEPGPTVFDDPALKAEAVDMLDQCLAAIRRKAEPWVEAAE